MEPAAKKIWFPAKKYGWGWGPPNCWQGWVVFIVWVVFLFGGAALIMPNTSLFLLYAIMMAMAMTIICLLKGEKPRWRWGKD